MFFSKSRVDAFPSVKFGSLEVKQTPTPPVSQVGSDAAEDAYRLLLSTLGIEESSRHELEKTPARAAKAFREMTIGLQVEYPLRLGRFWYFPPLLGWWGDDAQGPGFFSDGLKPPKSRWWTPIWVLLICQTALMWAWGMTWHIHTMYRGQWLGMQSLM